MKILVVGHEGYVGSALFAYFRQEGHESVGYGRSENLLKMPTQFLRGLKADLVVNCAAAMDRISTTYQIGGADEEVNVNGVRQLIKCLEGSSTPLIQISTKDVYGPVYNSDDVVEEATRYTPKFEIPDDQKFSPITIYAKTKLMGEFIAQSHERCNIVRLSTCYTSEAHFRGNWVVRFCRSLRDRTAVQLTGNGKQTRDLLHADDLGRLILKMAAKDRWGLSFNAGGGRMNAHSVVEVLDRISGNHPRQFLPGGDFGFIADNRLAREIFDWVPEIRFFDKIDQIISNVKNERKQS